MKFLEDFGFTGTELIYLKDNTDNLLIVNIISFKDLVIANLNFLKDLGVDNYKKIFLNHAEMFLMDNTEFKKIFAKYDQEDLVIKLKNNSDLIEQL